MAGNIDFFATSSRGTPSGSRSDRGLDLRDQAKSAAPNAKASVAKKGLSLDSSSEESFADHLETTSDRRSTSSQRPQERSEARTQRSERSDYEASETRRSNSKSNSDFDRVKKAPADDQEIVDNEPTARPQMRQTTLEKPVNSEATQVPAVEGNENKTLVDRTALKQKAVVDFMSEMKQKFGVSSDEVVSAFAQLDEEALNGRPEDAMNQFLAALQIPQNQMPEARMAYMKMVRATGDSVLSENMTDKKAVVQFEVLNPKEMKMKKVTESLSQMNDRFFSKPQPVQGEEQNANALKALGLEEAGQAPSQAQGDDKNNQAAAAQQENKSRAGGIPLAGLGMTLGSAGAAAVSQASGKATSAAKKAGDEAGSTASALGKNSAVAAGANAEQDLTALKVTGAGAAGSELGSQTGGDTKGGEQNFETLMSRLQQSLNNLSPAAMAAATSVAGKNAYQAMSASGDAKDAKEAPATNVDASLVAGSGLQQASLDAKIPMAQGGMILAQPQMTPEQRQENINEIIKQAQVVLKNGGGEMKMELRPEGLGQVHLKVAVEDGQVNVQMITENDSAKKLIEGGLNELKSQLAAHKLHVETLKVESGAEAAFKKFEQGMNDQQREQARNFASDFMGQFREDRQSFFGNWMDNGGRSRGYKNDDRTRGNVDPTPVDAQNMKASSTSNRRQADGNRRLNLVA